MAQKLIPGLRHDIRIAILQQTATIEQSSLTEDQFNQGGDGKRSTTPSDKTVLQQVIESDVSRNIVLEDLKGWFHFPLQVLCLKFGCSYTHFFALC